MDLVFLFVGLLVGFLAAWFIAGNINKSNVQETNSEQLENLNIEKITLREQVRMLNEKAVNLTDENYKKHDEVLRISGELAETRANFNNLREKLENQKVELEKTQEQFSIYFKNLANDILEEKTRKFTEQNKTQLSEILKPLGEKIRDFEKKVEETYDKESQQRFSLKEEVKRLAELNQQISKEATNLTNALKGNSKTMGNWGEMVLENILEKSGLVRDREYFVQASFQAEDGRRQQPDIVISYPGEKNIVIDSKVSMVAYERHVTADDDDEKETALKEHLISIKNHINELSAKNYQDIYKVNSLDFVMMFLPVEPAYLIAVQKDPDLWHYAYNKRILLISPTNLITALKMVASLWLQEYQSKNVLEIAQQSGALYDKFEGLVQDLIDIGKRLDSTQIAYKNSMVKLRDGKGNLINRVENIKKLGAKTKKSLPQNLIDRSNYEEDN